MPSCTASQCCVLGVLGVLACTPRPAPSPATASPSAPVEEQKEPPPSSEPPPLPMPQGQAVSFPAQLSKVSQVRGLAPLSSIAGLRVSADELIAHVERAVALERPPTALRGTEIMLSLLGLVPGDFDLESTMLELLSGNLAGLYEPRLNLMLLRDGLADAEAEVTLLHELVHALQDQHYDLSEIVEWRADDSDVSSALSSLAEGDATSAMLDGALPAGQTALSIPLEQVEQQFFSQLDSPAPAVLMRSLFAPYLDGLRFVHELRERGGWAEVDRVWKHPPQTTEQVLHLEKYDQFEPAIEVAVPAAPPGKWVEVLHDVWGEQTLRIVLEEWTDRATARAAATGWGGDRIVAFEQGENRAMAWHIVFDDSADAQEMFAAAKHGGGGQASGDDFCVEGRKRLAPLAFSLQGRQVTIAAVANAESASSCTVAQQWAATQGED